LDESGQREEALLAFESAKSDLEVLKRILQETRANLSVLSRLHAIRIREALFLGSQSRVGLTDRNPEFFGMWSRERMPDYGDN
jgi:hypothetical protein